MVWPRTAAMLCALGACGLVACQRDDELSFAPVPRAWAAPPPAPAAHPPELPAPAALEARARRPLVVLDPGHGGPDRGSPGLYGLWEGDVALDIALRARARLLQFFPSLRTRLTRESDVALPLEERVAMANALGADLFVSVHLNAASSVVEHGGVTTFVLDVQNDRNVLRLAARENGTSTGAVSPLQFLVGSLLRKEQHEASLRLAQHVQRSAVLSGRRYLPSLADRGVRSAMFHVLVGAHMPAILLEGSFLTQPEEARMLTEPAYRDALAEGLARGIVHYLAEH